MNCPSYAPILMSVASYSGTIFPNGAAGRHTDDAMVVDFSVLTEPVYIDRITWSANFLGPFADANNLTELFARLQFDFKDNPGNVRPPFQKLPESVISVGSGITGYFWAFNMAASKVFSAKGEWVVQKWIAYQSTLRLKSTWDYENANPANRFNINVNVLFGS